MKSNNAGSPWRINTNHAEPPTETGPEGGERLRVPVGLVPSLPLWLVEQGWCLLLYLAELWAEKLIQESEATAEGLLVLVTPHGLVDFRILLPHPAIPRAIYLQLLIPYCDFQIAVSDVANKSPALFTEGSK